MNTQRTLGLLFLTLATGCAGSQTLRSHESQSGALRVDPALLGSGTGSLAGGAVPPAAPAASAPESAVATEPVAVALPVETVAAPTAVPSGPAAAEPNQPVHAKTPAPKSHAAPRPPAEPPRTATPARAAADILPAVPAALDVASLTSRLRETRAIGVFTKLALKNQMDDLLTRMRDAHRGGQKSAPAALRQPYDMLLLKVLAVLQDGDPGLAGSIAGSREAIWAILCDPDKFKAVA